MTLSDQIKKREERKKYESSMFHRQVGENLRRLREKHNYTQEYVASDVLGKKVYSSYGKMESGEVRLGIEDASVLSRLYNISIDKLLHPHRAEGTPAAYNEDREGYPVNKNTVEIVVKLDGSEMVLVRQIELLKNINHLLSED